MDVLDILSSLKTLGDEEEKLVDTLNEANAALVYDRTSRESALQAASPRSPASPPMPARAEPTAPPSPAGHQRPCAQFFGARA